MKKLTYFGLAAAGLFLSLVVWFILLHPPQGILRRTPLERHAIKVFSDAGVQMDVPLAAPFMSSGTNGILVMLHPISRGRLAEPEYLVEIDIRRISKEDFDSHSQEASRSLTDDFNKWLNAKHPSLDIRKDSRVWYIRKDMETPSGQILSIDCEIRVTQFAEKDLLVINRIVESVKPLY